MSKDLIIYTKNGDPVKWDQTQATRVENLAIVGVHQAQIAKAEGLEIKTLLALYREELVRGGVKGIGAVAKTCFQMATDGKHPQMTIFYLRTRGKWKYSLEDEIIKNSNANFDYLQKMNKEELEREANRLLFAAQSMDDQRHDLEIGDDPERGSNSAGDRNKPIARGSMALHDAMGYNGRRARPRKASTTIS